MVLYFINAFRIGHKVLATMPIKRMPIKLNPRERATKKRILIFEKPKRLTPNSSGKGEAIMKPPTRKVSHLKYFSLNNILTLFPPPWYLINSIKYSDSLS